MKKILWVLIVLAFFTSCIKQLPEDSDKQLKIDYNLKRTLLSSGDCDFFNKLENCDSISQPYLRYLFAYMPLSDFADYDFEFFERHVEYSLLAKETFPWSKDTPDDIFMHYVLPPRVNNENLDTARMVIFNEIKERLLTTCENTEEAALEVNHWCHEKVIYRGTDERTISPLGIMRSGFGRCGEESTFLVTALRSVGIPARQVYTPRWAHTDDNHAWVEVWIEGEWKYMGACEPSPALNMGWFTVPATRAMLVHTKQFGENDSNNSDYLDNTANYTWINALETYAPVKTVFIRVENENKMPVWLADVRFQLYNYAELYPLHKTKTDFAGLASFKTGYGSLEVSVSYNGNTASKIINANDSGIITVVLGKDNEHPSEEVTYFPPIAGEAPEADSAKDAKNKIRLAKEDSIRTANEAGYYDDFKAKEFVRAFGYPKETNTFLIGSRGNWFEIESFLIEFSYRNMKAEAFQLLSILPEKDLRDTKTDILASHLELAYRFRDKNLPDSIFRDFVLNPRIAFEMLTDYRPSIIASLDSALIEDLRLNPEKIEGYVKNSIKTDIGRPGFKANADDLNRYNVPLSPKGVQKLRIADSKSLLIYYVAFCRTLGIPARIDNAAGLAQFYKNGTWVDATTLTESTKVETSRGTLILNSVDKTRQLKYRIHFSIARFEDGFYNTVDLGWEIPITEFASGLNLPEGDYMLLTSLRNPDGSTNVKRKYFDLPKGKTVSINVELPESDVFLTENRIFNHSYLSDKFGSQIFSKGLCAYGRATAFCWINPSQDNFRLKA
jgi:transglutaminase-like putative cysteine protease